MHIYCKYVMRTYNIHIFFSSKLYTLGKSNQPQNLGTQPESQPYSTQIALGLRTYSPGQACSGFIESGPGFRRLAYGLGWVWLRLEPIPDSNYGVTLQATCNGVGFLICLLFIFYD